MKKVFLIIMTAVMVVACQNNKSELEEVQTSELRTRTCATDKILQEKIKKNPALSARMSNLETLSKTNLLQTHNKQNQKYKISVVVNVLYNTPDENISDEQIQSQIDVLNQDFNALNSDYSLVPTIFSNVKANVGLTFELDKIIRVYTPNKIWENYDEMKKAASGGINPTSPGTKLNMWVCKLGKLGGPYPVLGYAQFPGDDVSTDGVVITTNAFGLSKKPPFDLGRTATHEVGHWLNLRHIWGDEFCGDDMIADTPKHDDQNAGVPQYPHYSKCPASPIEMTMNYMDYCDDIALYMFTNDQKKRMLSALRTPGSRASYAVIK